MTTEIKNVISTAYTPSNVATAAKPRPETNVAVSESSGGSKNNDVGVTSPRLRIDPNAGVIIQFLDNKGDVAVQTPSFAAVAYLKAGLTSDGYGKAVEDAGGKDVSALKV
jgi:hypothetical protein